MLSAVVTAATAGSITGMPSTRLKGSASPKKERQPKTMASVCVSRIIFCPQASSFLKVVSLSAQGEMPFKLTAAICPMRSGLRRAYAETVFSPGACFVCQYYSKAAAYVKRCQAGGLCPADNGNTQCFAAGVDNGVAEAIQNNGLKTGVLPSAAS